MYRTVGNEGAGLGAALAPVKPVFDAGTQLRLAVYNRATKALTPSDYGASGKNDADGNWGKRSKSAWASYGKLYGLTDDGQIMATLVAETSGAAEFNDDTSRKATLADMAPKGGTKPAAPPPAQPKTTGTVAQAAPTYAPRKAGMGMGTGMLIAGAGVLALGAMAVARRAKGKKK